MKLKLGILLSLLGLLLPLVGEVVYDNSVNDLKYRFPVNTREFGDEVVLGGTQRGLTYFQFEYWGIFEGYVEACVRFYRNDALDPETFYDAPGTVLFDSGFFRVDATPRLTLIFEDFVTDAAVPLTQPLPDAFTWTVQFRGLATNETAGVDIYSPPLVGAAFRDYWENDNGNWVLKTNSVVSVNFAVLVRAEAIVRPELTAVPAAPSSVTLSWPVTSWPYRLQQSSALGASPLWSSVTNVPARTGQTWTVSLPRTGDRRFFRLINP